MHRRNITSTSDCKPILPLNSTPPPPPPSSMDKISNVPIIPSLSDVKKNINMINTQHKWCKVLILVFIFIQGIVIKNAFGSYYDEGPSSVHSPSSYGANTVHHFHSKAAAPFSRMVQEAVVFDESISNSDQDMQQMKLMSPIITNNNHHAKMRSSSEGEESHNNQLGKAVLEELVKQQQQDEQSKNAKPEYVDRMIVYNGEIIGKVPPTDLDSTVEKIQSMLLEEGGGETSFGTGGYVSSHSVSYLTVPSSRWNTQRSTVNNNNPPRRVNLTLRINSYHFLDAVQAIKDLINSVGSEGNMKGKVTSLSTNGQDVTDEYVDTTARADTLDSSRKALQILLAKAETVDDVLKVQSELDRLTQTSESLRRRALELKKNSQLSTLTVILEEFVEQTTDDGGDAASTMIWTPTDSVSLAMKHMSYAFIYLFDTATYGFVWAIPFIICYLAYVVIVGRSK